MTTAPAPVFPLPDKTAQRRFLFAVLKNAHQLEPEQTQRAAEQVGCDPEWLESVCAALRLTVSGSLRRVRTLRRRRNRAFARRQLLEVHLSMEMDPERCIRMALQISRLRVAQTRAQGELAAVRLGPTNKDVALALGIPKGTVDSGLFWLKRRLGPTYAAVNGADRRHQQPTQSGRVQAPDADSGACHAG